MFDIFKQLFSNKRIRNQRLKICNSCEHKRDKWLALFSEDSCAICKCSIKKKISLTYSKCPKEKW